MGIAMEEAVIDDLFAVVLSNLYAQLMEIDASFLNSFFLNDVESLHVRHGQDTAGRIVHIGSRRSNIRNIFLILHKTNQIICFFREIQLLFHCIPEFFNQGREIQILPYFTADLQDRSCFFEQAHILLHLLVDTLTLYLDNYIFAGFQYSRMHLRDRGGADGFFSKRRKQFG